jgi:hypothetical protein
LSASCECKSISICLVVSQKKTMYQK